MSDTWTLTHGSDTKSLKDWGITQCVISEPAFNPGMLNVVAAGDMAGSIAWAYKDQVILKLGSVVKFRGTALPPKRSGRGNSEYIISKFADPWWWLGQAAYTQTWWDANTAAAYQSSRVALFAAVTAGTGWSQRSIGAEIAAIIAHCNTLHGGGKMQIGTLSGDSFALIPMPQRLESATHEVALRELLKWVPDAIPSWDHSTNPPTLNITQRAAATARSYSFADTRLMMSQEVTKRQDMTVTGVRIVYAGIDALGNPTAIVDSAGATSGSGVVETVVDTTHGSGGGVPPAPNVQPAIQQAYTLISETIDPTSADWWFQYGDTGAASAADIIVVSGSIALATSAPENAGKSSLGGCNRQWLSGGIPQTLANVHTRIALVTGKLIVHTVSTAPGDESLTFDQTQWRTVRMLVPTTDLNGSSTLLLKDTTVSMPGGIGGFVSTYVPSGIAAQLYASWSQAQYDGELEITAEDCSEAIALGDVVNITDGLSEWATMRAVVQGLNRDVFKGKTSITLGIAAHLALNEFAQLIKVGRVVNTATDIEQQTHGITPTGDPDTTTIPQLVNPGSIKISVLEGKTNLRAYRGQIERGFTTDA